MKKKWLYFNKKQAFSLIELLVVITIISILIIWLSNLNFKWQQEKEELEKKVNKVINIIEEVQFNSLVWKSIKNFEIPKWRKITFSTWSQDEFILEKFYKTGAVWFSVEKNILEQPWFLIKNFYCSELNSSSTWSFSWTWEIIFEWRKLYLSGSTDCNWNEFQKFEIDFKLKRFEKKLIINTVSWNIIKK